MRHHRIEQWGVRQAERTLGLGVTSARSALGRRIQEVLAGRRITPLSRQFRAGSVAAIGACLFAILLIVGAAPPEPTGFDWAKAQGWSVRPVQTVTLNPHATFPKTPQPAEYSVANRQLINQCQTASAKVLQRILAAHPHFFYAEYSLAAWYWNHHNPAGYWTWLHTALHDAPAVLAGRVVFNSGKPVRHFSFLTNINCYSRTDRKDRDGLLMDFQAVVTDAEGCYYLPVYRAMYGQNGPAWWPGELKKTMGDIVVEASGLPLSGTVSDDVGDNLLNKAFVATARVGVLPNIFVRPTVQWNAPLRNTTAFTDTSPLRLHGGDITISWKPYPHAVRYTATMYEDRVTSYRMSNGKRYAASTLSDPVPLSSPVFIDGISHTWFRLNLTGRSQAFNRHLAYSLVVYAHSSNQPNSNNILSSTDTCVFRPVNALAPQSLTKAAVAQAVGPGSVVNSITSTPTEVTVSGTTLQNVNHLPLDFGSIWGLRRAEGRSDPTSPGAFTITFSRW